MHLKVSEALIVKIQKKKKKKIVFYSDMTNNRLIEWFYFWLNIDLGFRDIKSVTELFDNPRKSV